MGYQGRSIGSRIWCFIWVVHFAFLSFPAFSQTREHIWIVGSSTVFPFSSAVAERSYISGKTEKAAIVESTGTGRGFQMFCGGSGVTFPDITGASRQIKKSEVHICNENEVGTVYEIHFGRDGVIFSRSREGVPLALSREEIFLALAAEIPQSDGSTIPNPHRRWSDISSRLANEEILVFGPPPTSGTRTVLIEEGMIPGCRWHTSSISLPDSQKKICQNIRNDGHYVDSGEHDNLIVQKLLADPQAVGIFGFSYYEQNSDRLQSILIDGQLPDYETIADGSYPLSRLLYLYAKKEHMEMVPGIEVYLEEVLAQHSSGEFGYLIDKGLIPLLDEELMRVRSALLSSEDKILHVAE